RGSQFAPSIPAARATVRARSCWMQLCRQPPSVAFTVKVLAYAHHTLMSEYLSSSKCSTHRRMSKLDPPLIVGPTLHSRSFAQCYERRANSAKITASAPHEPQR